MGISLSYSVVTSYTGVAKKKTNYYFVLCHDLNFYLSGNYLESLLAFVVLLPTPQWLFPMSH